MLPDNPKTGSAPRPISFYVVLGTVLFAFNRTFSLLYPFLLSLLLVLLIFLAVNPVIYPMRAVTGGTKIPTEFVVAGLTAFMAFDGLAPFQSDEGLGH